MEKQLIKKLIELECSYTLSELAERIFSEYDKTTFNHLKEKFIEYDHLGKSLLYALASLDNESLEIFISKIR